MTEPLDSKQPTLPTTAPPADLEAAYEQAYAELAFERPRRGGWPATEGGDESYAYHESCSEYRP